jgi:hypothetical protein
MLIYALKKRWNKYFRFQIHASWLLNSNLALFHLLIQANFVDRTCLSGKACPLEMNE